MTAEEKFVEESFQTARHYLDLIVKEPASAVGGVLADRVNYWRWKNKITLLLKAKKFLEDKGIEPKQLLPSTVVPLIDAAADVDDPLLSDMFAGLLASHVATSNPNEVHPSYTKILEQLSPLDAVLINEVHASVLHHDSDHRTHGFDLAGATEFSREPEDAVLLSFENLWRLGLCDQGRQALARVNRDKQILLTDYGWHFMVKCQAG